MLSLFLQHCLLPPMARAVGRRFPTHSKRHSSSLLPFWDGILQDSGGSAIHNPVDRKRHRLLLDLHYALEKGTPGSVWLHYTNLLDLMGHEKLDIRIHQAVLRKCTRPSALLRFASSIRLRRQKPPRTVHLCEGRFRTVIQNIRAFGQKPSLDDYHFILGQFAAVGHHEGALNVYRDLTASGIEPVNLTFGLCLQAIAHRLTLPIKIVNIPAMVAQVRAMTKELLDGMRELGIPFTSVNMDLTIRIMKYTMDEEGFESLLRVGYGIDMNNPDRPALEVLGLKADSHSLSSTQVIKPLYFSTSALNTVLDMYGMTGNISKMVQAFEVLTVPLPRAQAHFNSSFEDEEDDFGVSPDSSVSFTPPHAEPNATTYNTLLKHISRAGHAHLARHYFLVAMEQDRVLDRQLRINLVTKPYVHRVPSPQFSLNRQTILSVFGLSNRDKNISLMRWLHAKLPFILRKKRADIEFYKGFVKGLQRRGQWSAVAAPLSAKPFAYKEEDTPEHYLPPADQQNSNWGFINGAQWSFSDAEATSAVDVTHQKHMPSEEPFKSIDLQRHIRILQRNIREISALAERIDDVLARTIERLKDRLGRRVWAGKNIYLVTGGGRRGHVSRRRWRDLVNYQTERHGSRNLKPAIPRTKWFYNAWNERPEQKHTQEQ